MLNSVGLNTSRSLALVGLILLLAGCAASRAPAPVESRTVYKSKPTTREGAMETRVSPGAPVPSGFYRVRRGDTLIGISLDHGVSWRDLADWNNLSNPNLIEVDQLIQVRPPAGSARLASAPVSAPVSPPPSRAQPPAQSSAAQAPVAVPPQQAVTTAAPGSPSLSWPGNGRVITQFAEPGYKGIALSGQEGDAVLAAGDGRVVYSGSGLRGYGNLVIVKHDGDFLTAYAHNRKILVSEGQIVRRGQQIAELGSTDSDIPKLHFEVRLSGKPVDPMRYLAQR